MTIPLNYRPGPAALSRAARRGRIRLSRPKPTPVHQPVPYEPETPGPGRGLPMEPLQPSPIEPPAPGPPPSDPPPTPGPQPGPGQRGPLSWNPQLPQHPLGAYTDATYEAEEAQLRADTVAQYQGILRQLGYMDPNGQYIRGTVEIGAAADRARLERDMGLAREQATFGSRDRGTLFSGIRAIEQARAEHPFVTELSDLDINTPSKLSDLYNDALKVLGDFETKRNLLLAEAADRYEPTGAGTSEGTGVGPSGESTSRGIAAEYAKHGKRLKVGKLKIAAEQALSKKAKKGKKGKK